MGEVPGLSYSNQGNGLLSERSRLGCWQHQCWVFFLGGHVPGKPVCSGASVYVLHPKKVELVLAPVCSGSCQSSRIAPRL